MSLTDVTRFIVKKTHLVDCYTVLRRAALAESEGLVFWAGREEHGVFVVETPIVPRQQGYYAGGGVCVVVDGDELHRINVELNRRSLTIGIQVHSHPGEAYHSETDDELSVLRTLGGVSIVVPNYASGAPTLDDCAAYRLTTEGWLALSATAVRTLIQVEE